MKAGLRSSILTLSLATSPRVTRHPLGNWASPFQRQRTAESPSDLGGKDDCLEGGVKNMRITSWGEEALRNLLYPGLPELALLKPACLPAPSEAPRDDH